MERFFFLNHLTTEQLRELYLDASRVGRKSVHYARPIEQVFYEMTLPEEEIWRNIGVGNHCFIAFRQNFDDCEDATTVGFPMAEHPFVTVYIDIDNSLLDRFAKKYYLEEWWQMEGEKSRYYPFSEFYRTMPMNTNRQAPIN